MRLLTDRLVIRELRPSDWYSMKKIAIDFQESEYAVYDRPLPTDNGEIQALTERFAESGLFFAVLLQAAEEMIGYICLHEEKGSYDLGYCFHSAYQGKGYACESCAAVLDAFGRSHHVRTFTAGTALKNVPSCSLLKKLGFSLHGTEIVSFHKGFSFEGGNFIKQVDAEHA